MNGLNRYRKSRKSSSTTWFVETDDSITVVPRFTELSSGRIYTLNFLVEIRTIFSTETPAYVIKNAVKFPKNAVEFLKLNYLTC